MHSNVREMKKNSSTRESKNLSDKSVSSRRYRLSGPKVSTRRRLAATGFLRRCLLLSCESVLNSIRGNLSKILRRRGRIILPKRTRKLLSSLKLPPKSKKPDTDAKLIMTCDDNRKKQIKMLLKPRRKLCAIRA